jgi:hypothetical protein
VAEDTTPRPGDTESAEAVDIRQVTLELQLQLDTMLKLAAELVALLTALEKWQAAHHQHDTTPLNRRARRGNDQAGQP